LALQPELSLANRVRPSWDNVDAEKKVIVYAQQKTDKVVAVPLHPDLLMRLVRLSEKSTLGPLCRSVGEKRQAGKHGLSEGFKRVLNRAGLELMPVKGKGTRNFARRSSHSLRHSFSSMLARGGVSEETRMRLTGHSSRDIHQRYTHFDVDRLQQAIDSIPTRPKPPEPQSGDGGIH
jgi:integrase